MDAGGGALVRDTDAGRATLATTGGRFGVDAGRTGCFFADRSGGFDAGTGVEWFLNVGVGGFLLAGVTDLVGVGATDLVGSFAAACENGRPFGTEVWLSCPLPFSRPLEAPQVLP